MRRESDPKIKAKIDALNASFKEDKAFRKKMMRSLRISTKRDLDTSVLINKAIAESLQNFSEAMQTAAKHMEACIGVLSSYLSTSVEINLLIAEISDVCQTDRKTILDKAQATTQSGLVEVLRDWKRLASQGDQTFLE